MYLMEELPVPGDYMSSTPIYAEIQDKSEYYWRITIPILLQSRKNAIVCIFLVTVKLFGLGECAVEPPSKMVKKPAY